MKLSSVKIYLKYVLRHKYHVYKEGRKLGIGRWQLLKHDMVKFLPCEFVPYAIWFAERPTDPRELQIAENNFQFAWLHHIHSSRHHWQYWILRTDTHEPGHVEVLRMPEKYVREMVADWRGVGVALGKGAGNAKKWYLETRDTMSLHPQTRSRVEVLLGVVDAAPNSVVVAQPTRREIGS